MVKVPLTQGCYALVDDQDFHLVEFLTWHVHKSSKNWYARARNERGRLVYMHRLIMRPSEQEEIDHVNGNGLDNQRSNLRAVDRTGNNLNRRGVRGYELHGKRYRVRFFYRGQRITVGSFDTAKEAKAAYESAKLEVTKVIE